MSAGAVRESSSLYGEHLIRTPEEMHRLGLEIAAVLRIGDVVVLSGALGAGKTTLTRGIGDGLGVRGPVTSPTFVLARTHPSLRGGAPLVHVDAYRLADGRELEDLDIDFARSVVVVEWGVGKLEGMLETWLEVAIERPTGAGGDIAEDEPIEPRIVRISRRDAA